MTGAEQARALHRLTIWEDQGLMECSCGWQVAFARQPSRVEWEEHVSADWVGHIADALSAAEAELRLAREEIRIREESQIPVIPRAAKERMDRLEAALREAREALRFYADAKNWLWDGRDRSEITLPSSAIDEDEGERARHALNTAGVQVDDRTRLVATLREARAYVADNEDGAPLWQRETLAAIDAVLGETDEQ